MGLFSRSKEGGMMDVIRCDEPEYLIWKWRPAGNEANTTKKENAIRYGSSLRVKDGEVAVFVYSQKDGPVQDYIVGPYDETIKTANFPVLSSIVGLAYAGDTPFQAEVYFINLAGNIQIKFGIPYFDVRDWNPSLKISRLTAPVAVRGTLTFNITDYKAFIKLNRLINFELDTFKNQMKDDLTKEIKKIVTNVPNQLQVPLIAINEKLAEIESYTVPLVKNNLESLYGITIKSLAIADVEIDKDSEDYKKLEKVTSQQDERSLDAQFNSNLKILEGQTDTTIQNMVDMQAINAVNMEDSLRIQREEMQRAQQLQTETNFFDTHKLNIQTDAQKTILTSAADSLGAMGNMNLGGGGGGGMNPAGMMTGMMMGGAMGGQMANMMNNMGNNMQQNMQSGPGAMPPNTGQAGGPPPPPQSAFHISINGQQAGPFNIQQLQQLVMNGQLTPATFVWKTGMAEWAEANKLIELQQLFNAAPPPPPPPPVG
jgi:membrane protease subunit (stomatin/prohibitin family)